MPALGALIANAFASILAWFGARMGERVALAAATAALVATSVAVAVAGVQLLVSAIVPAIPAVLTVAFSSVLPDNTASLLGVVVGVEAVAAGLNVWRSSLPSF